MLLRIGKFKQKGKHYQLLPHILLALEGEGQLVFANQYEFSKSQSSTARHTYFCLKDCETALFLLWLLSSLLALLTPGLTGLRVTTVAHGSLRPSLYRTGASQKG